MSWDKPCDPAILHPDWSSTAQGTKVSLVIDVLYHADTLLLGTVHPGQQKVRVIGEVSIRIKGCRRLTFFDLIFDSSKNEIDLLLTDQTIVFAHGLTAAEDMFRCVELCAGLACSSTGLSAAGFRHVCSVEWRAPLVGLHRICNPAVPVILGDISDPSTIKEVMQRVDPPFTMMTGFSCQPYSAGGSQGGSCDDRSSTVPATVRACYLCQCPLLILECVTQARTNQFVRSCLQVLTEQLGYHLCEVSLKLEDNWCAKRYRWWVVASHPAVGPLTVPVWPKNPSLSIRDVMPFLRSWSPAAMQELELTAHEQKIFTLDGSSLRRYQIQLDGKLATSLHSAGSQADACPCGCRQAFSECLIRQRGVYAQLIQCSSETAVKFRHLHPCELAILNAMPPPQAWMTEEISNLRLCLGAIGQLASPLQSVWVGACVMQQVRQRLDFGPINPIEIFNNFKGVLMSCARELFPNVPAAPSALEWTVLVYPDGTSNRIQVHPDTTVIELFQAEFALTNEAPADQWVDSTTGQTLDFYSTVAGKCIRVTRPVHPSSGFHAAVPDSSSVVGPSASPIPLDFTPPATALDFPDEVSDQPEDEPMPPDASSVRGRATAAADAPSSSAHAAPSSGQSMDTLFGFCRLSGAQLSALVPPLVPDLRSCKMFRQANVHSPARLEVLENQGSAMGDDELTLHMYACLCLSSRVDVQFLDPLLALGWLKCGTVDAVKEWIQQFPSMSSIITALPVNEHWIPIMWSLGMNEVRVSMWEHVDVVIDELSALHGLISTAWQKPLFSVACNRRSFARGYCGAASVAFAFHKLLGKDLPASEAELVELHADLKASFVDASRAELFTRKPWCWGLGIPDVLGLTADLLKSHGVPEAQASLRAKMLVQALGKTDVQKAITGTSPWRSLKALANLQNPPIQMVLPDEQHQHNQGKPASKPKGRMAGKKVAPSKPAELDPAKLVLDHGAFCVNNDEPLDQVPFASLGPLSSGVAITSFPDAVPFLTAGRLLTNHGLALLVLNPPPDVQTQLTWSTIRFAARCSMNQEPMLVCGLLVQLGRAIVYQYTAKDIPSIPTVEVACARISVFQDQWDGNWEDFAVRPVKHVLAVLTCLQTCRTQPCQCPAWHPPDGQSHDAVLDVFRRQFFSDSGRSVKWDKATHFGFLVRYVKGLERQVLSMSGQQGIFIEPKTEDALQPHHDYQVVWLPQLDFSAVAHMAKCEVDCVGVARSGKRFGLRVHVANFQRVFTSVKPEAVYLAPGSRVTYQCGPWPFGSDRKAIAKILKAGGWECRPLQPLHHVPGGLMWAVQAVTEPPVTVLAMQHGQVLITRQDTKVLPAEPDTKVVGHAKTVELCRQSDTAGIDPWLTQDPWSKAISAAPAVPVAQPAPHVLHELEHRLEQSILAKLPTERMEVDDQDQRLQALESQVQQLASKQAAMETTIQDHHQQNSAQVQTLQQQMKVQLDLQTQHMSSMLTDQMSRIEAILAKKPRTEWKLGSFGFLPASRVFPGLAYPFKAILSLLLVLSLFRIGEARVPGPDTPWKLGICNPSGLQGKHHIVSGIDASVVAISETHLTQAARRNLEMSLRSTKSRYKHVLTGAPLLPRAESSDAGAWSGVAFTSAVPCRTLAVAWPPDLYETGRIQLSSFFTSAGWISGAVIYGYPEGRTHLHAKSKTEGLLDFAFDRLQLQPGPRFMAGDWNFTVDSLDVFDRLRLAGWVEAQDLCHYNTGRPVANTCKGVTRKDYLWLSPELAIGFLDLRMDFETFADHAVLVASFNGGRSHLERFVWPCPKPIPWAKVKPLDDDVPFCHPHDPTVQYANLWKSKEVQAQQDLTVDWLPSMAGRGAQTTPRRTVSHQAPLKQGRAGDVQPAFFGFSSAHAKQFKQVRRLQNYCRWIEQRPNAGIVDCLHGIGLWNAILRASGFGSSFSAWWPTRQYRCPADPVHIPQFCPGPVTARQIFDAVLADVRLFEQRLNLARSAHRGAQHDRDRHLVFRDVARDPPEPVETLLHRTEARVVQVDADECAVELDNFLPLFPLKPCGLQAKPKRSSMPIMTKFGSPMSLMFNKMISWSNPGKLVICVPSLKRSMNSGSCVGASMTLSPFPIGLNLWLSPGVSSVLAVCLTSH